MKYKAIVFDKDGTLVDFPTYWRAVATYASNKIFSALGVKAPDIEEHLSELGFTASGVDITAALPRGDHAAMATIVYSFAKRYGSEASFEQTVRVFAEAYGGEAKEVGEVRATAKDLGVLLSGIRSRNIRIALITSDEKKGAAICLDKLGVAELFDTVLAYDGVTPAKPNPASLLKLCEEYGISPCEVIMVGDTETDMLFAKNSGAFAIGLADSEKNSAVLFSAGADAVVSDLWQILEYL